MKDSQSVGLEIDTKKIKEHPEALGEVLGYQDLTPVHGQWIKLFWEEKHSEDLLLMAYRHSYKTTAVVVVGILWYLLFNPDKRILVVKKSSKSAIALLSTIRQNYRLSRTVSLYEEANDEKFFLKEDKETRVTLSCAKKIVPEASVEVVSMGTKGVTGRHYDRIHLDDIVDENDQVSANEREKTKLFFYNLKSVIKPGKVITLTGTPWHKDDLYSKIKNVRKYKLGFPGLPEIDSQKQDHLKSILPPKRFAQQYLLIFLTDKEDYFSKVKKTNYWNKFAETYGHLDCAYGGADTNALSLIQRWPSTNFMGASRWVVMGYVFEGHISDNYHRVGQIIKNYNVKKIFLETNADQGFVARDLEEMGFVCHPYREKMQKHRKIVSILYRYFSKIFFSNKTTKSYLDQIIEYNEAARRDDAPDSLASLLLCIKNNIPIFLSERKLKERKKVENVFKSNFVLAKKRYMK